MFSDASLHSKAESAKKSHRKTSQSTMTAYFQADYVLQHSTAKAHHARKRLLWKKVSYVIFYMTATPPRKRAGKARETPHAQDIYREAFNSAWQQYARPEQRRGGGSREAVAHRVAWAAVKKVYEKRGEVWVPRER